jgi:Carbon-nitrogen hydrolase
MENNHLRLGVVQIDSRVGDVAGNLKHAGDLVEEAANQGAQLVLLPELMPSGYTLTEEIWNYAEPFYGPTVGWLTQIAKRLHVYLGTSFLEVEGEDFYNTFALASPQESRHRLPWRLISTLREAGRMLLKRNWDGLVWGFASRTLYMRGLKIYSRLLSTWYCSPRRQAG